MFRKFSFIATILVFLSSASNALAQSSVPVQVNIPQVGINPGTTVGTLLSNALTIIFVAAGLAVLFMLIFGAFQWITSGGSKEGIDNARKRIVNALIGLALLALAFFITRVVGQILNIDILNLKFLPTLDQCTANTVLDPATGNCITPRVNPNITH